MEAIAFLIKADFYVTYRMTQREKSTHIDRLQSYRLLDWQPLFDLIPYMEKILPERENELVSRFVKAVNNTPNIIIVFDWGKWEEGKNVLTSNKPDFSTCDLLTLCLFITTIVRADRFNEGFLTDCYRKGIVLSLLRTLKERVEWAVEGA